VCFIFSNKEKIIKKKKLVYHHPKLCAIEDSSDVGVGDQGGCQSVVRTQNDTGFSSGEMVTLG